MYTSYKTDSGELYRTGAGGSEASCTTLYVPIAPFRLAMRGPAVERVCARTGLSAGGGRQRRERQRAPEATGAEPSAGIGDHRSSSGGRSGPGGAGVCVCKDEGRSGPHPFAAGDFSLLKFEQERAGPTARNVARLYFF